MFTLKITCSVHNHPFPHFHHLNKAIVIVSSAHTTVIKRSERVVSLSGVFAQMPHCGTGTPRTWSFHVKSLSMMREKNKRLETFQLHSQLFPALSAPPDWIVPNLKCT